MQLRKEDLVSHHISIVEYDPYSAPYIHVVRLFVNKPISTCMAEIKSLQHDERSYVAFVNRSTRRAALLWHNYEGTCVRYAILNPGGLHQMNTYVTHPWSVIDIDSGDFLKIDNQLVFYPRSHKDDDNANGPISCIYEKIYIDLPVYTLLVRCLQVLRSFISREDKFNSLNIPVNLRHALKFVPEIKYTNYAHFQIVEGNS